MQAGATTDGAVREWRPPYPVDPAGVLAPLRRGRGDPTWHSTDGSAVWRAGTTPDGPATTRLARRGDGTVVMHAWGPGAAWSLDGLPALLGDGDDPGAFVAHHPLVADAHRRMPGIRFCATRRVWDVLVPAVLEQKVTGTEARRSWRELCRRFGDPAPGPAPAGLRIPPTPGADPGRARLGVAPRGRRLRPAPCDPRLRGGGPPAGERLHAGRRGGAGAAAPRPGDRRVDRGGGRAARLGRSGRGERRRLPHPRTGRLGAARPSDRRRPDAAGAGPYAPQRARAVRYVELSGFRKPRFGPRYSPRDYRAM